jgi:Spy/CpxP family protein refolding chaperone
MEEVNMKAITTLVAAAALSVTAFAGVASADSTLNTRSPEAAHADLVRDWSFNGGGNAGQVRQRTKAEMQADLVRNWNGPTKAEMAEDRGTLHTRSEQQAYDDLVRNWN